MRFFDDCRPCAKAFSVNRSAFFPRLSLRCSVAYVGLNLKFTGLPSGIAVVFTAILHESCRCYKKIQPSHG